MSQVWCHLKNKINASKFGDLIGFIEQFMNWGASLSASKEMLPRAEVCKSRTRKSYREKQDYFR